jgi:GDP-D-mannose dehydratase
MKEKTFDSFSDLRKESYHIIKEYRESFMLVACKRFGIYYDDKMRRRDFMALMDKHNAQIVKNEDNNHDELIINGEVVAYWNRNYTLKFYKGNLICEILIFVKE